MITRATSRGRNSQFTVPVDGGNVPAKYSHSAECLTSDTPSRVACSGGKINASQAMFGMVHLENTAVFGGCHVHPPWRGEDGNYGAVWPAIENIVIGQWAPQPSPLPVFQFMPRWWPGAPSCQCSELLSFTVSVARTLRERTEACDTRGLSPGPLLRVLEKPPAIGERND